jgi:hypothetical protein
MTRRRQLERGADITGGPARGGRSSREFDDEPGRVREAVVLPTRGASWVSNKTLERQPTEPRETALDPEAASRLVDDAERLVKPDGDLRSNAKDEGAGDSGLRLGERPRSGVLEIAANAERTPAPREVAI